MISPQYAIRYPAIPEHALLLLIIFGEIPVFRQPSANLSGYSAFDIYIPILMSFSIAIIAFTYLPGPLGFLP